MIENRVTRHVLPVVVVGTVLCALIALNVLAKAGWDVTTFGAFGEDSVEITEYADARLGPVVRRPQLGHDGRFFFVQANDPLLLDPSANASILDRPQYRSQRMLYPLLAGGAGLFPPGVAIWSMVVVNLLAFGLGTWAVSLLAIRLGASPWWGLAFALNPGLISEMSLGGAGVLAAALGFMAVLLLQRHDGVGWVVAVLTLSVLTREVMAIVAVGSGFWLWTRQQRRQAWIVSIVPILAAGLWAAYVRMRVGVESGGPDVREIGFPSAGYLKALGEWVGDPLSMALGILVMVVLLLYVGRVLRHPSLLGWAFFGFAPLAVLLTEPVWTNYFDFTRAIAPLITAYVVLVAASKVGMPTDSAVPTTGVKVASFAGDSTPDTHPEEFAGDPRSNRG